MKTIGFIGLGVMGELMAANLEAAGYAVQSYDLKKKGNRKSARAAAEGADALITMLPDGDAVRDAVLDALPALTRGAVVVDMSSSDPAGTRALGDALKAQGVGMVLWTAALIGFVVLGGVVLGWLPAGGPAASSTWEPAPACSPRGSSRPGTTSSPPTSRPTCWPS